MDDLVETVKGASDDSRYGITTVQPNRALKKCRIRSLLVEYVINRSVVVLTIPRSCGACERIDDCTDDFIIQIIEKTNPKMQDSNTNTHYFLP